jgi:acyl carrier protein
MMMTETVIRDRVREFFLNEFMAEIDSTELTDDMSFESAHIIDSVGMMDLILFVEEAFEFEVENEEALPENFDSVANLVVYVTRKQAG